MNNTSPSVKLRKGDSVITPNTVSEYLTSNKDYLVLKVFVDDSFLIRDDIGKKLFCKLSECGHINGNNWNLKN